MAISRIRTILPLDNYAQYMHIPLTHFNQLGYANTPKFGECDSMWDQDDRDYLATTISDAEKLITDALRFSPAPVYELNEQIKLGDKTRWDWWNAEFKTKRKHVVAYGLKTLTLVQEAAPVTYIDDDNDPDGIKETAMIGSTLYDPFPICDDECNLRLFFRVGDGAKDAAHPDYEIRGPIYYDRDPDADTPTYIIKGPTALFVKPTKWKLTKFHTVGTSDKEAWHIEYDPDNNPDNFVASVDVYCESVNTANQAILYWNDPCTTCGLVGDLMCATSVNDKTGAFKIYPTDGNILYSHKPENLRVSYKAGYPLDDDCRMNTLLQRAIIKLTNALLPEPPCGYCDVAHSIWRNDRENVDRLTLESANMPWELMSKGALDAWRIVKRLAY